MRIDHCKPLPRLPRISALALTAALAVALLTGCASTTVTNPVSGRAERTVMDEATEVAEGRKAHAQVLAEYGALDNPALQAYVNALGQRLARQSHRNTLQWHFTVLDSAEINAFALPGGYVYVTRGILAYMDSEADLAGVIGHEIGHVTARHGAQRATREQDAGLGVLAATVLGIGLEGLGVRGAAQAVNQVSQGVAAGLVASYSREQELQADQLGAEYLQRSRLDPKNMVDVIGVLKDQERFAADSAREAGRDTGRAAATGNSWLASHPSNDQRLQQIRQVAAAYQGPYDDDGRLRYLRAIDGLGFGDSRAQGVVRGRQFFHEPLGLALSAPAGWRIQNGADAVLVMSPGEDAALILRALPADAGSSHEDILRKVFKPTQGRSERMQLNGLAATHFSGQTRDERGQPQALEVTLVTGPGGRTYALTAGARDAAALQRAQAGLREAEASLRPFSAADRAAARPWVLRSVALPAGGLAELARRSPLPQAERQLRLLNGVYAGGDLRPGQVVKVVE